MDLSADDLDYLHGRRFSNGRVFSLGQRGRATRRSDRLMHLARGKQVLHVGCCDHLPLIRDKMALGIYLHDNLCRVAARCVGSDINAEGIRVLHELGFQDVHIPEDVPDVAFDVCMLADVIEHVGDPVSMLRSLRRHRFDKLVVATPNAFRWRNWLPGGELINTDHRFWFSPYTLCKILVDAGYEPQRVELCHGDHVTWRGSVASRLLDWMPRYRDTLLVEASP